MAIGCDQLGQSEEDFFWPLSGWDFKITEVTVFSFLMSPSSAFSSAKQVYLALPHYHPSRCPKFWTPSNWGGDLSSSRIIKEARNRPKLGCQTICARRVRKGRWGNCRISFFFLQPAILTILGESPDKAFFLLGREDRLRFHCPFPRTSMGREVFL